MTSFEATSNMETDTVSPAPDLTDEKRPALPTSLQLQLFGVSHVIAQSTLVARAITAPLFNGMSKEYIAMIANEYCKFLLLKSYAKDTNAKHVSPSGVLDILWNLHLLDTKNYMEACKALGVSYIHNDPDDGFDVHAQNKRFENTALLYKEVFGCCPPACWNINDTVAIGGGTCLSLEQQALLGQEKCIVIECGHVDCKCEHKVYTRLDFVVSREQQSNLFWSDHSKEDKSRAVTASNVIVNDIVAKLKEPFESLFLDRLGMTKRRKEFFLRDYIPSYIDAVQDCPNHTVGVTGLHPKMIQLTVKVGKHRTRLILQVLSSYSVFHVKVLIRQSAQFHPSVYSQTLMFGENLLENNKTLADYGITSDQEIKFQPAGSTLSG